MPVLKPVIDFTEFVNGVFSKCKSILTRKNHDYADSSDMFSNFKYAASGSKGSVEQVFLTFISTKVARLAELLGAKKEPNNEGIEDTFLDLINYTLLLWGYRENTQRSMAQGLPMDPTKGEQAVEDFSDGTKILFADKIIDPSIHVDWIDLRGDNKAAIRFKMPKNVEDAFKERYLPIIRSHGLIAEWYTIDG